jgi:hypothetical protein
MSVSSGSGNYDVDAGLSQSHSSLYAYGCRTVAPGRTVMLNYDYEYAAWTACFSISESRQ